MSVMDAMFARANAEDDSDKDIDVIVSGELITYSAMLRSEQSHHPTKEREWLSAM